MADRQNHLERYAMGPDPEALLMRPLPSPAPPPPAELRAYVPTLSDRTRNALLAIGVNQHSANFLADLVPWTPMGQAHEGGQMIGEGIAAGSPGRAGLGAGLTGLAIFAGPAARTANIRKLERAQEMLRAGRSRDDIWSETGWFRGNDGRWRFEIDDSGSRLTNEATAAAEYRGPRITELSPSDPELPPGLTFGGLSRPHYVGPMESGLHHPNLYAAYPELRRAEFRLGRGRNDVPEGYYAPMRPWPGQISASAPNDPTRHSVSIHEVQHAVREREGGPMSMPIGRTEARLMREHSEAIMAQLEAERPRSVWERLFGRRTQSGPSDAHIDELGRQIERIGADEYHRQIAEVEARNAQARILMSPDQRRARPPWTTQDVPDEQQILR